MCAATRDFTRVPSVKLNGRGETILLVDDNESVRCALAAFLELKGYNVLQAEGGQTALQTAEPCETVDLLISDVDMPEMSGRELARRLQEKCPNLKVLFLSGHTQETIALESGSAFLSKPASMQSLLAKIRAVLEA